MVKFKVELDFKSANSFLYKRWTAYYNIKKKYNNILSVEIGENRENIKFKAVHIKIFNYQWIDFDNLACGCKPIVDWITNNGYIIDDSPDKVVLSFSQDLIKKPKKKYIIITLK